MNRVLHLAARFGPGAESLRPFLHRLRGVRVGAKVFIGEDVYIENEYPHCVEIQEEVQIGLRTIILAHLRGPGKVIIEKQAYIGPNCVIAVAAGRTLTIGAGAVLAASSVVTSDVETCTFVRAEPPRPSARVAVPLSAADSYEDFLRGLSPIRPTSDE